jgi:hypothetical protein
MSFKPKSLPSHSAFFGVIGTIASSIQPANAKRFGPGFGLASDLVGTAIVGGAIAANDGHYSYRSCGWVRQFDGYGNFIGRVRVCN